MKKLKITRTVIRICFFGLFIGLAVTGSERFWLPILIGGIGTAFLFGHWYCAWVCPVNTVAGKIGTPVLGIKSDKNHGLARFFRNKWVKSLWLTALVSVFILCLIFDIRVKLFVLITLLGVVCSIVLPSAFWCRNLCPWMVIMELKKRVPFLETLNYHPPCHGCVVCFNSCRGRVKGPRSTH